LFGDRETESGTSGYRYRVYGTSLGFDVRIDETSLLGLTGGYSDSDVDYALAGNHGEISGTHLGLYGSKQMEKWHFDSIVMYSDLEYETKRYVNLTGERLKGDYDGRGISGYIESRYDWRQYGSLLLQPLASFQFSYLKLDSYTETGGPSSLGYDGQSYDSYKGSLGMKLTKGLFRRDNDRNAYIQLRGRWVHEFGDDNSNVDAHFASNPGAVFNVGDEEMSRNSAVLGAGFGAYLNQRTTFIVNYDAKLNSSDTNHLVSASLVCRY
jgi:subtilase-type serine protease